MTDTVLVREAVPVTVDVTVAVEVNESETETVTVGVPVTVTDVVGVLEYVALTVAVAEVDEVVDTDAV